MTPTRIITDPKEVERLCRNQPLVTRERAIRSLIWQDPRGSAQALAAIRKARAIPPSSTFRCK